jgi:hypothetical protein
MAKTYSMDGTGMATRRRGGFSRTVPLEEEVLVGGYEVGVWMCYAYMTSSSMMMTQPIV